MQPQSSITSRNRAAHRDKNDWQDIIKNLDNSNENNWVRLAYLPIQIE